MAFIFRGPRSSLWQIGYTDAQGKRWNKTAGTPDKRLARKLADALEKGLAARKAGTLFEAKARELLNGILAEAGSETLRQPTARAFVADWLTAKLAGLGEGSKWSYRRGVDTFIESLGTKAEQPLEAIQSSDARAYEARLRREGYQPKSISLYCKVIRSALREAVTDGLIPSNPFGGISIRLTGGHQRGTYTEEEVGMLIRAAARKSPDWETVVTIAAYSGARLRDCCRLKWMDIDLVNGTWRFIQLKTGGRMFQPMHDALKANFECRAAAAGDTPEPFVTPSLAASETGGSGGLSEAFAAIMREAGVSSGSVTEGTRRRQNERGFHSLRHTFVSALANANISSEVRMFLTGHADLKSHQGYNHAKMALLADAVNKLPTYV